MDLQLAPDKIDLRVWIGHALAQANLNVLNLLRNGGEDALLQSVELVETSPGTHLRDTEEDATHGLEVESVVAVEYQRKATELDTERFDRLSLTSTCRAVRRTSKTLAKGL